MSGADSSEKSAVTVETSAGAEASKTETSKKEGPKFLDLAFAMDCTGSMGSYIKSAQQNIHRIVDQIVSEESADVRLALVEYRDHPPQDQTFVTNVNDFTSSVRSMKKWLDACRAQGGGDQPEAVADALHQVLKLSWREEATKVCVFISDAPPHGLGTGGDTMPNGCPDGLDPMTITNELAAKHISLYTVGCEPSITPFKDFFMGLAHLTGGQYVPLSSAHLLAKVITGGVQEEMALHQLMEEVNQEVMAEFSSTSDQVQEEELTRKVHEKLKIKGARAKKLQRNNIDLPEASPVAQQMSHCADLKSARSIYAEHAPVQAASVRPMMSRSMGPPGRKAKMASRGAPPPPMAMAMPSMEACMDLPAPASSRGASADDYLIMEDDVSEAQVNRMVQKSVISNKLKSRVNHKY